MKKREQLHQWLMQAADWVYLVQVPHDQFSMSKATCSSALADLCEQGRADFRVVGIKQYRGVKSEPLKMGPKPPKGLK